MSDKERRFDYVIVGAGPSALGLVLGLLEHVGNSDGCSPSIAVIERGGRTPVDKASDLSQWYPVSHEPSLSTRLVPTSIRGRIVDLPIGQGLGGGSIINAGLVMPPPKEDYEKWPEPWSSLLPVAVEEIWKRLEHMNLLQKLVGSDVSLDCCKGWEIDSGHRCATLEEKMKDGSRQRRTYFQAFFDSSRVVAGEEAHGIEWVLDTEVQRLLISREKIVHGVECSTRGDIWRCYATKAVILCAGAIESPALLLTSGLGPETHENYQGVGCHLQDQVLIPRVFLTPWHPVKDEMSSNGIASMRQLRGHDTILQVAVVDSNTHSTIIPPAMGTVVRRDLKSSLLRALAEFGFQFVTLGVQFLVRWTPVGYFLRHYTQTILLFWMHPTSEGSIRIEASTRSQENVKEPCRRKDVTLQVDVGYGRDPLDSRIVQQAWHDLQPPCEFHDLIPKRALGLLWNHASLPYFHYIGTCAMKRDDAHLDWVVDPWQLKLRDHEGIHICDASVFPAFVSVPPALTCFALGYAFGQTLLVGRAPGREEVKCH